MSGKLKLEEIRIPPRLQQQRRGSIGVYHHPLPVSYLSFCPVRVQGPCVGCKLATMSLFFEVSVQGYPAPDSRDESNIQIHQGGHTIGNSACPRQRYSMPCARVQLPLLTVELNRFRPDDTLSHTSRLLRNEQHVFLLL